MPQKNLDALALKIITCLQEDDGKNALELGEFALSLCKDRVELELKLRCWTAQAALLLRDPHKAARHIVKGLKVARLLQDVQGERVLKDLQDQAQRMGTALALKHAKTPLGEAMNQFQIGNKDLAVSLAEDIVAQADMLNDTKNRVLARLSLAQFNHMPNVQLSVALEIANAADDHNLISAVKRTMDIIGHQMEPKVF